MLRSRFFVKYNLFTDFKAGFVYILPLFLYTRKLYYEHFTPAFSHNNNLREFIPLEHKFKGNFVLKKSFKRSF